MSKTNNFLNDFFTFSINNALKVSSKSIMKRRFNSIPKNDHDKNEF